MPLITTAYHTQLAAPITDTAAVIRVDPNQFDLCDTVSSLGKNVVLTIFNAKHSELVLATGCGMVDGIQHVTVQRGFGGTTAREWVYGSCLCTANIIDKCSDTSNGSTECTKPLAGVQTDGCLEIVGADTCTPTLRIKPTGVTPVDNDCIRINACGLVEWVSPTFPADCIPAFDPCSPCAECGGGGAGGGASSASAVSYNGAGGVYAVGPTVQDAITQLDLATQSLVGGAVVTNVGAGAGLSVGGTVSSPVLSMTAVFGAPGVYNGFTVNQYGQITGYNQAQAASHIGTLPIAVAYNNATNTFTYSVASATTAARGVVQLVDTAEVSNASVTAASNNHVVTWDALLAFVQAYFPALNTSNGVSGSTGIFNSDRTLVLDIAGLTQITEVDASDVFVVSTPAGINRKVNVGDYARDAGGAYASAVFNGLSGTAVAARSIGSITRQSAGVYLVVMSAPVAIPSVYVVNAVAVNYDLPYSYTFQPLSASQFELRFIDGAGAAFDPDQIGFTVVAAG